jgi:RNA polymerase sigma-70 factor, ECF subfamily
VAQVACRRHASKSRALIIGLDVVGQNRQGCVVRVRKLESDRVPLTRPVPGPTAAPPPHAEAALLAATAAGDAAAFRQLVALHLSGVVAIARGVLRDASEAEDMAQEAFLRLWRNAAQLELGPGGVKPWLRRVVSNLCIDRIRSARNTTLTDAVPEQPVRADQIDALEDAELANTVAAVLQTLPERQRLALVLFHFEGLSQIEVGAALDVSDEAVESLLSRARRSLRTALKDNWRGILPDARD